MEELKTPAEIQTIVKMFNPVYLEVDINSVFPNKWNPNSQKGEMFSKLVKNIRELGQIDPVLCRQLPDNVYEIVDGEHRFHACREIGNTTIAILNLGHVDDSLAKVLTINMNNIRGTDDVLKRAQMIKEIEEGQLSLLPFSKDEIEFEKQLLDFDFSKFDKADASDVKETDIVKDTAKSALTFYNLLTRVHTQSKDSTFRLFIEQFFEWYREFLKKIA